MTSLRASRLPTIASAVFRIKRATSTLIGPYETANVLGESTFVEFFPEASPPLPGITLGLVLSFDRVGESAEARAVLEGNGGKVAYELNRRETPGSR